MKTLILRAFIFFAFNQSNKIAKILGGAELIMKTFFKKLGIILLGIVIGFVLAIAFAIITKASNIFTVFLVFISPVIYSIYKVSTMKGREKKVPEETATPIKQMKKM